MARLPHPPATPALARAVREWSGWFIVAAGAVLCVLGWYGIAGESVIEQQLPYLASATIPGAAMIVAGATLIASRPTGNADARIETLYSLLVTDTDEAEGTTAATPPDSPALLAMPGGTLYHRRDCPLVAGKPTAEPVDAATIAERSLEPCPVCEPPADPGGGPGLGQPAPNQPSTDHPAGRAAADQSSGDRPAADQPAADEPSTDHPAGRAALDRPAADQPSADRPAADPRPTHPGP